MRKRTASLSVTTDGLPPFAGLVCHSQNFMFLERQFVQVIWRAII